MCLLVVLCGLDEEFPIVVASNRDERRDRRAAPPGLFVGERRRMLSPRDRERGGTWLAVNDAGMFAGLTNLGGAAAAEGAPSRGGLPHLALDQDRVDDAASAVREELARAPYAGFQLVVTDGVERRLLVHEPDRTDLRALDPGPIVLSNEHRLGELELRDLAPALAAGLRVDLRLDRLAPLLLDTGSRSGHPILKLGGAYGTVSSSLIAIPHSDPRRLIWRYAPGPPNDTPYRNYGNLGRRLVEVDN